jgi:hypothetical protein
LFLMRTMGRTTPLGKWVELLMAIQRYGGFSARVEAYLVVCGERIVIAKTGPDTVTLVEPCELPPGTIGELEIIFDGYGDSRLVVLDDGAMIDRREVRYSVLAPF